MLFFIGDGKKKTVLGQIASGIINFSPLLSIWLVCFCSFYYKILLKEDCSYNQLVFICCKKAFLDGAHNVLADEVLEVATIVSSERASP